MNEHHFPLQETLQVLYFITLRNEPVQMFVSGYRSPSLMCWVFMTVCTALLIIKVRTFSTIVQRKGKAGSYIGGLPVSRQPFLVSRMPIQITCFQMAYLSPPNLPPQASIFSIPVMVASVVKHLPTNTGDIRNMGLIPGSGRSPGGGHDNPVFLPGESHGQRSLLGHSPWSYKESDMTEATTHVCTIATHYTFWGRGDVRQCGSPPIPVCLPLSQCISVSIFIFVHVIRNPLLTLIFFVC